MATTEAKVKWSKAQQKAHRVDLVEALRSGKFKQGHRVLTRVYRERVGERVEKTMRHCCLGVGCQIASLDLNVIEGNMRDEGHVKALDGTALYYEGDMHYMPPEVCDYYGFRDQGGTFHLDGIVEVQPEDFHDWSKDSCSLVNCNDEFGWDFDDIADLIENAEEIPGLLAEDDD